MLLMDLQEEGSSSSSSLTECLWNKVINEGVVTISDRFISFSLDRNKKLNDSLMCPAHTPTHTHVQYHVTEAGSEGCNCN